MKRVRIRISGEVQGVFYRKSAQDIATELGLGGWVKTLSNGHVLAEAEGEPAQIEQFITWCYRGPDRAVVAGVETENIAVEGDTQFSIRY